MRLIYERWDGLNGCGLFFAGIYTTAGILGSKLSVERLAFDVRRPELISFFSLYASRRRRLSGPAPQRLLLAF